MPGGTKWTTFGFLFCFLLMSATVVRTDDDGESEDEWFKHKTGTEVGEDEDPEAAQLLKTSEPEEENDVLVLNKYNYDFVTSTEYMVMVHFYTRWCGHCKDLQPRYEAAAKRLKKHKPPVKLAKLDATVEVDIANRYELKGYPILKYFKRGKAFDYDGPLPAQEDDIVNFMVERASPGYRHPEEFLISMDNNNFTSLTENEALMMVMFYAPWCSRCKKLLPEFTKAAKKLGLHSPPVKLAKVDAIAEKDLARRFGVDDYPVLKIFRKGKDYKYLGPKEGWDIVKYMKRQIGPPTSEVKNIKQWQNYLNQDDVTVMAFFTTIDDDYFDLYAEAGNQLREDFKFGHTFNVELRKPFKAGPGSIVLLNAERFYTSYEPKFYLLQMDRDTKWENIDEFLQKHKTPLVGQLNWDKRDKRYKKRPLCVAFYSIDWSTDLYKATQLWRKKIADIAKDYKNITFAVADEDDNKQLFADFGFEESGEEVNFGCLNKKDKKFPMPPMDSFDPDDIKEFIAKFNKGNVKARFKTQLPPRSQKTGPGYVITVVGSTFEKIVLDRVRDVLIYFTAPWCDHCKRMDPKFEDVARKYSNEYQLVLAKIDGTANEAPANFPVNGYPTLYFVPANNKEKPILYMEPGREMSDLIRFIEKHAVVSLASSRHRRHEL